MEEDIKILEDMFYDDESFEPNGYVEIFLHKNEQQAIKNLISRYKKLEEEFDITKCNYEILQGDMDRIGVDILKLEPGNSTEDVADEIKRLIVENKELKENYVLKSKIKAEIEKREDLIREIKDNNFEANEGMLAEITKLACEIIVLQELLEES